MARLIALAILLVCASVSGAGGADAPPVQRVLILHSFGREFAPYSAASSGFRTELAEQSPASVEFLEASLETARIAEGGSETPVVEYLRALFVERPPHLLVPFGAPAMNFLRRHRDKLFPGVPMLVGAIDKRRLDGVKLGADATSVGVDLDLPEIVENILRILPNTKTIEVVIGNSPLEKFWLAELREDLAPFNDRVRFNWLNELSFEEMRQRVAALPPNTAVLFAILVVDAAGVPHEQERALEVLRRDGNAAIFGVFENQLGRGIVGGPLYRAQQVGREGARLAVRILNGESAGTIQPVMLSSAAPVYDWRELKRWNISEDRLPPGSMISNRPPSVWAQYQWYIVGALVIMVIQAAMIADLLLQRTRRRRAEAELRESRQFMEMATEAGEMGLWVRDLVRGGIWANPRFRSMFDLTEAAPVSIEHFLKRVHPEDSAQVTSTIEQSQGSGKPFEMEFRTVLPGSPERWISARGQVVHDAHGRAVRSMGTMIDITKRKQAEEQLRESEQSFRTLAETTAAVPWTADMDTWAFTYVGPQAVKLLGYPVEEWYENDFWVSHLHPDDRDFAVNTCLALSKSAEDFEFDYRMVASSGKAVWVHDIVNCQYQDGHPVQLRGFLLDISERKQTEAALEQSENQVRLFVEHAPASVAMFDREMRYVLTSRRWLKDYNLGEQNIIGRSHYEIFPEITERWKEIHRRCLAGAVETCEQDPFRRLDGSLDWVRWEVRPWYVAKGEIGGIIMFTEVITDRKRAEEELRRSEEWLRLAAEGSRLGVWYWDEVSKELSWDGPTRQMFGVPADAQITLETFYRTLYPDDLDRVGRIWRHALETRQPYQIELRVQRFDGSICWIHARGRGYYDEAGNPTRMIGVVLDITERKEAESELQRQRQELAHITRVSTMGELAASLAHELNQPLTAILSNAQAAQRFLAADKANLDEIKEILSDIIHDNSRAGEVIRRMRTLFRKEQIEFASLDLASVISEVALLAHTDAITHNIRVLFEFPPGLPPVRGDRVQLQQVILNLIVNAFHAMRDGPLQDREVIVKGEWDGTEAVLAAVRDRGIGLGRDKLEKIFQPFYTTKQDGLGMGLSISRSIIEAHGGRLWAENNLDGGATFYFTLPVSSSSDQRIFSTAEP